jgi:NADH-quinone oxidoreductase subunit N
MRFSFNPSDLVSSAPLLLLTAAGLLLLLLDAFSRSRLVGKDYMKSMPAETSEAVLLPVAGSRNYLMGLTVLSLVATLVLLAWQAGSIGDKGILLYRDMLIVDRFGLLVSAICVLGALIGVLGAPAYLRAHRMEFGEYYALILFVLAGIVILIQANDLATVFLGVETMSLGAYVLTGSWRRSARSSEAAMKYFLVGAFVSGILVYGIALIYGTTGSTSFSRIREVTGYMQNAPLFCLGWMLLLVSFAFKIGAVPFHMWAPDTYEGAPTPVSGFMMSAVKTAGFAALIRLLVSALPTAALTSYTGWVYPLQVLAVLTMTLGNLAALRQDNVKRMLAYSSISHAGYLLIGVVALGVIGDEARGPILYYLLAYTLTVVGSMGVVAWLGADEKGEERVQLSDWAGLASREPAAALAMTISLLSLAGFPPTAGFFGKFYLFRVALGTPVQAAGAHMDLTWLVLVAIANSLVSVYYYLRLITALYFRPEPAKPATTPIRSAALAGSVLLATLLILGFGLLPEWFSTLSGAATLGR